jgi:N-methylhydantoinase B/oxoprolinase/acetone carboxylase alpha subunit
LIAKMQVTFPAGQTIVFETPGGGGLGAPADRRVERIAADRTAGYLADPQ